MQVPDGVVVWRICPLVLAALRPLISRTPRVTTLSSGGGRLLEELRHAMAPGEIEESPVGQAIADM